MIPTGIEIINRRSRPHVLQQAQGQRRANESQEQPEQLCYQNTFGMRNFLLVKLGYLRGTLKRPIRFDAHCAEPANFIDSQRERPRKKRAKNLASRKYDQGPAQLVHDGAKDERSFCPRGFIPLGFVGDKPPGEILHPGGGPIHAKMRR